MEIRFYRCISCGRAEELNRLLARHHCRCGTAKVRPTVLGVPELVLFILMHPSYLYRALTGGRLYADDPLSD